MPFGCIVRVRGPIEAYHALHRQILELLGPSAPEGAILHVARPTEDGFEVFEVWESKEQLDAFNRDVLDPAMAKLAGPGDRPGPEVVEFTPTTTITFTAYEFDPVR